MLQKFKKWLNYGESPYIRKYFETENVRSGIFLSVIFIALEIGVTISVINNILYGPKERSLSWIVSHLSSYLVLIILATVTLVYDIRYLKGKKVNETFGRVWTMIFSTGCIIFGIYISAMDYAKGEQVFVFTTMVIFTSCMLVHRPLTSLIFSSISFVIMYFFMDVGPGASYATRVNFLNLWVAVFVLSISSYYRVMKDAKKEESLNLINGDLEKAALTDPVTGLSNMSDFDIRSKEFLDKNMGGDDEYLFLFTDIENFGNYNEQSGYEAGDILLKRIAEKLEEEFKGCPVGRMSDDHFVVLTGDERVDEKLDVIRDELKKESNDIGLRLVVGGYRYKDSDISPMIACDNARHACAVIKQRHDVDYYEYDEGLAKRFRLKKYVVNHIDEAVEKGYVCVYYQPVVWSKTKKMCCVEALARWIDPRHGFLSPGDFIPALEEYRKIHIMDRCIIERVCRDISDTAKKKGFCLPVSVNISRLDFQLTDIIDFLNECVKKYDIDKEYIHIEITETALADDPEELYNSVKKLKMREYPVWLDDFGSGYSSLNLLKDYEFDVMKIDMQFLSDFSRDSKGAIILKNIIELADDINMRTLSEGVETDEQADFLAEIGCERLQGYRFGKPMPLENLLKGIDGGEYTVSEEFLPSGL